MVVLRISHNLITIFFVSSILYIVYLTMLPHPSLGIGVGEGGINLIPFDMMHGLFTEQSLWTFIINVGGNIFLFVPFGYVLPWKFPEVNTVFRAAAAGALLSACIEIIQLLVPSRFTDIDDIILNTGGVVIGYGVYRFVQIYRLNFLGK
ncbi:VanZ family protein [Niallia nealsonii]|uniref:VanZ-like domain-containing protein n=1 Tax=Niallia nealsonii TaxID=115979 RepID=A0A2N0Z7A1_9BACI|nr:VanZ family protein [Niallia nealsonii]PKG25364.1 hypothetical protein CWS01_02475 [Niallia nealsonii]